MIRSLKLLYAKVFNKNNSFQKNKKILIFVVIGLLVFLGYFFFKSSAFIPKHKVTINTLYPLNESPIGGVTLDILNKSNQVVNSKATDNEGIVKFYLPDGEYTLKARGGYKGEASVVVKEDKIIKMNVSPFF